MNHDTAERFGSLREGLGRFNLAGKRFLIPQMNRIGCHLLAATFRGFGINAQVMDTCRNLDLGMEYTSGKECYPCQITMADILYFLDREKELLEKDFDPEKYVYFMPEADGPCRFGMYNKYQRIVLDSLADFERVKIGSMTTKDGYSLDGMIEKGKVTDLRKASYLSAVVADILDRFLWRIRPYEREEGMADDFIEAAMGRLERAFEERAGKADSDGILESLEREIIKGRSVIDPDIPRKPLIGIVGEIYLRTHTGANQDTIRVLEKYGAEVVNASICEWINYTTYDKLRDSRTGFRLAMKQLRINEMKRQIKKIAGFGLDLLYQQHVQKRAYGRIAPLIDLVQDHKVSHLEKTLKQEDLFSFDIGTEACLSIPSVVEYARSGFNGVVNIYPFTCMPSTIASAVAKPVMSRLGVPYLDTPYDSSIQPGREAAIRTFMYQACQHHKRHSRGVQT